MYLVKSGATAGPAYNVSGDIGSLDTCQLTVTPFDVTGIDKSVHERLAGLLDAKFGYTGFWNPAAGGLTQISQALAGADGAGIYAGSAAEGAYGFAIEGLITDWSITRAATGALTTKTAFESDVGNAVWGMIGANATDASNTATHTPIDFGASAWPPMNLTATSVANPTHVTVTAHGMATGDSVNITASNGTPNVNGDWVITVLDANTFTVPVNVTAPGNTGVVNRTSAPYGGDLVAFVLAIGTGTILPKLQHSADNGVADAYADIAGMVTPALSAANAFAWVNSPTAQIWKRWVKIVDTGTFTNCQWVGLVHRNMAPGV
jgi:hypothetical protein